MYFDIKKYSFPRTDPIHASFTTKSAYFWGGVGTSAKIAASEATAIGAKTLGQTAGGKVATWVGLKMEAKGISYATQSKWVWEPASRMFAKNAQSFGGLSGTGGRIWHTIEKPILRNRKLIP